VQAGGRTTEVQLLGHGNEVAQVTKFDIHIRNILTETNGILEVLVAMYQTRRMDLMIRPLRDDSDAAVFRELNEEWIAQYFAIEEQDRRQLDDPVAAYIETGGEILIAELDGRAVGCVALMPDGTGAYELSKMAIAPGLRGRGAGRRLLSGVIDRARELGASSLFLGSSRKLANAVHLYESLGFRHVAPETLHMPYARADVFMALQLDESAPASPRAGHNALSAEPARAG
jgi:putative acetyltransferase